MTMDTRSRCSRCGMTFAPDESHDCYGAPPMMTLRQWYAGLAMQAGLTGADRTARNAADLAEIRRCMAEAAVANADALIAALARKD